MSTELSNGVIIPEEYSDDWYDEMSINLRKLNDVITAASDNATDIQRLDTDKANQSDLTALSGRVSQNETDIIALQTAVSGALKREIVQTLPTEDISTTTIYMIRNSQSSGTNIYDEYMYINSQWELIGTSATDFSNYYTKNETDNLLSGKVDNSTLGSYYTKTESDNLLSAKANQTDLTALSGRVTQTETDITALQTAVSGALKREIVQTLPTQDISTTTIYMIRNTTTSGDNIYDEYMYINNLWELIGTSATDFSNYYTKTEIDTLLSGKADDNSVVHTSGNETVGGIKNFTDDTYIKSLNFTNEVASTSSSSSAILPIVTTVTYTDQTASKSAKINLRITASGDKSLFPHENNQYALGLTSRKWSEVHGVTYYYGSSDVEFSTKFVTTDTDQTVGGSKTFSSVISSDGSYLENETSVNERTNLCLRANRDTAGKSGAYIGRFRQNRAQGEMSGGDVSFITFDFLENSVRYTRCFIMGLTDWDSEGVPQTYYLTSPNSKGSLGTSSKKWVTINGLEPSALGMPSDRSARVDISGYFTNTANGGINQYTAVANGFIYLKVSDVVTMHMMSLGSNTLSNYADTKGRNSVGLLYGLFPVRKDDVFTCEWYTTATNVTLDNAYFIPCQGNI